MAHFHLHCLLAGGVLADDGKALDPLQGQLPV